MTTAVTDRQMRERAFHDHAFTTHNDVRQSASKFYAVGRRARTFYESAVISQANGRQVLEYGCGPGSLAVPLARQGACTTGIDISGVAIAQAREKAAALGIDAHFEVMDAEALTFAPQSFDLICGRAILHHLDLTRAAAQLARVLRPGGTALFWEPLGHNPLINLYRRSTPALRTVDEHPLLVRDLDVFREHFGRVDARFFTLAPLAAVPFRAWPGFRYLNGALELADRAAFRLIPPVRKYAWQVVLILSAPRAMAR